MPKPSLGFSATLPAGHRKIPSPCHSPHTAQPTEKLKNTGSCAGTPFSSCRGQGRALGRAALNTPMAPGSEQKQSAGEEYFTSWGRGRGKGQGQGQGAGARGQPTLFSSLESLLVSQAESGRWLGRAQPPESVPISSVCLSTPVLTDVPPLPPLCEHGGGSEGCQTPGMQQLS